MTKCKKAYDPSLGLHSEGIAVMRLRASTTMLVVKKEEKEARIRTFIEQDLSARRSVPDSCGTAEYRLLALSAESPAAKALVSLAPEAGALGIEIRVVYLAEAHSAQQGGAIPGLHERLASDQRLLDAHEQLLLGGRRVWIGDCMRRDPGRRDGLETYSEECEMTSIWAARTFERLWIVSEQQRAETVVPAHAVPLPPAADAMAREALTIH